MNTDRQRCPDYVSSSSSTGVHRWFKRKKASGHGATPATTGFISKPALLRTARCRMPFILRVRTAKAVSRRSGLGTGAGLLRLALALGRGDLGTAGGGERLGGVEPLGQPAALARGGDLVERPHGALQGLGGLVEGAGGQGRGERLHLGLDRVFAGAVAGAVLRV